MVTLPEDIPEPDRSEGAPHPRHAARVFGHERAEAGFLDAWRGGRLHHGWLITGPRGVGKATLAWRIARFLLAEPEDAGGFFAPPPPETLDIPDSHPVARHVAALSEPRLFLLRRGWDDKKSALKSVITVDEARGLKKFFGLSAADGGRRVVIVDAADEMNPNAANAILKLLEEPPARATLLLLAHQPARLLPTIRSRCRELRLAPLGPEALSAALDQAGVEVPEGAGGALAELAGGSAGEAIRLAGAGGLDLYAAFVALMARAPGLDRMAALKLIETATGKGASERFEALVTLIDLFLARTARTGALGQTPPEAAPGEAAVLSRLAPDPWAGRGWAELAQTLGLRVRRGKAVNLDPAALLMDMVLKLDEAAASLTRRG